ncbi:MAG: 23S rRNA (guanosine(2251)-2'-O)-methyltransferase RlmB, partial [Acidimicrobiales bacterium]
RAHGQDLGGDLVAGRRAVRELLAAGRRPVRRLWLAEGLDPSPQLDEIEALATRARVRVETVPRARLEAEAGTEAPQGVLATARPVEPVPVEELCGGDGATAPFLLVVCGVTDPRNLGALLRSAECAGVTGVVLPRHRAARLSPTVAKVASGAVEHLAFAVAGGIPTALRTLTGAGVWTVGLAGEASASLYDLAVAGGPVALVVGGEERGLPQLVRRRCDEVVAIPQHGALPSLNVGVAGAVACFEVARRRAGPPS